jgi:CRP-like cAMP-binding protein
MANRPEKRIAYFAIMEQLVKYLLQHGQLNQQQIDLILSKSKEIQIRKDGYFSEAGKIAKQVGFITEGILRVCYYNNAGEDEHHLVVDLNSFDNKIPSSEYVQAITDCRVIVISYSDWQELLSTIVGFDAMVSKIISRALLQKVARISPLVGEDATTRYLSFMEKFPNMANRIPLSYLASYLGITQSSLSRIRKNIR